MPNNSETDSPAETEPEPKLTRTRKNAKASICKARSKVIEFIKAGKELEAHKSDSDSGDEVIDLVMRPKKVEVNVEPIQQPVAPVEVKPKRAARKPKIAAPVSLDLKRDETVEFDGELISGLRKDLQNTILVKLELEKELNTMKAAKVQQEFRNNALDINRMRQKMLLKF